MKFNREKAILTYLVTFVSLCEAFEKIKDDSPDYSENSPNEGNFPRTFGFFSRPKPPSNQRMTGFNPLAHVQNAFNGGSIGFQFELNPARKVHNIVELGKKKIGFFLGNKKRPQQVGDPKAVHETEDTEKDWEPQYPEKPKVEGPHWEDIGENPNSEDNEENPGGVTIPIEDIIQPRVKPRPRPKRFIESKIYHVPLLFESNAKPNQVKIRSANLLSNEYGKHAY